MSKTKSPTIDLSHISSSLHRFAVPIGSISQDPANARLHPERSVDAIKASLRRVGQQKPVVIDSKGVIIAGNGMHMAAHALGWSMIAAVRSDLAGIDRAVYAIADNRTPEHSEWDKSALVQLTDQMGSDDIAATGFTSDELADLVAPGNQDRLEEDSIPVVAKFPISRAGDLWILGSHRLLCGDCTKHEDVQRVMASLKARLFATDPPYLVDYDGTNHPGGGRSSKNKDWSGTYGVTWDDADAGSELYPKFIAAALAEAVAEDAAWYCWYASKRHTHLEAAWIAAGILPHCQIIWAKNRPVITRTWYMWQHEPCLMGWKKGSKPARMPNQGMLSTVWEIDTIPNGDDRPDHPTPKPLEVFAIPMRQHTRDGDVCFEPFCGSGSQIIAAEQLSRRCFAIEIMPVYVDVAIRRWQQLTGGKATLDGDGRSFAEVEAARSVENQHTAGKPVEGVATGGAAAIPAATPRRSRRLRGGTGEEV